MPLESNVNGIEDLNGAWPTPTDPKSEGDDHLRNIKNAIQGTFPGTTAPWTTTENIVTDGQVTHADATIDGNSATLGQTNTAITDAIDAYKATLPTISFGSVGAGGGGGGTPGSGDWVSSKSGTGTYTLTFNEPSPALLDMGLSVTCVQEGAERTATIEQNTTQSYTVYTRSDAGLDDCSFSFVRISF